MSKFVAFLRGINVGGKTMKMQELTQVLQRLGYTEVKTLLASGNIVFASEGKSALELVGEIEAAISEHFKFKVTVQVRDLAQIKQLVVENPFSDHKPSKDTHWYVTFLNTEIATLPIAPADSSFQLLSTHYNAIFSILDRTHTQTTDFMTYLDRQFGKQVTTRNWNTILKIAALG
jgi:uncharacterized protein (DUF1697 family)